MTIRGGVLYNCDQCEYKATKKHFVKKHSRIVHEGKRFVCSLCDDQFKSKASLKSILTETHMHTCIHTCALGYLHYLYLDTLHICIFAYLHVHTCIPECLYTRIPAYLHSYIHAYLHNCILVCYNNIPQKNLRLPIYKTKPITR